MRTVLIVAALLLSACASAADGGQIAAATPAEGRDCFFSSSVRGFDVIDNNHVNIRVGANRNYVLTTSWNASDLNWAHAIAIRSSTGSICTGNGLGVEIIGGRPRQTYPVQGIERAPEAAPAAPQGS